MNVQPIADSKTQLQWVNQRNKTQKQREETLMNIEDGIAFVTDFSSPANNNQSSQSSKTNTEKPVKKNRRLSYTSENWIG
ncbi:MAG: hypothetical protein D4R68_04160 [Ignavibacteriales bacterium]|nr:MAG: hypothetical protein D4R68_04160 [Ignavibacteriales bacterium]